MKSKWEKPGTVQGDPGALKAFGFESLPVTRLTMVDPAVSDRQRKFMGAELARKRAGKKTRTGMSEDQLQDYARKPKGGYKK